jgi:hypothetical protein
MSHDAKPHSAGNVPVLHKQGRQYKLAGCLTLWTVAMRGRWPSKRGAIYELFHHYLPTAKRHDANEK